MVLAIKRYLTGYLIILETKILMFVVFFITYYMNGKGSKAIENEYFLYTTLHWEWFSSLKKGGSDLCDKPNSGSFETDVIYSSKWLDQDKSCGLVASRTYHWHTDIYAGHWFVSTFQSLAYKDAWFEKGIFCFL